MVIKIENWTLKCRNEFFEFCSFKCQGIWLDEYNLKHHEFKTPNYERPGLLECSMAHFAMSLSLCCIKTNRHWIICTVEKATEYGEESKSDQ